ncbi:MAG: phosphoenolpyruvate carboxylase [Nitrososphaerota archaeon]|nr:phosphoenolpyruvate carboxylase [Aigarchaeota archaeon]MDW8076220.1 phosphoenolpyruvate carboxylase [Nitrososphaerota archaeon]
MNEERRIPKTMSTQHPDNASIPPWCDSDVIEGEKEVYEAYYAYSALGCQEVMWDSEGKDIDPHVVRKLLTGYPNFFKEKILGKDIFLTYRIPNPTLERVEKKVFLETLQAIPKHFDVAKQFYENGDYAPVFEVILPFTSSHKDVVRVLRTYSEAVVGIEKIKIDFPDVTLAELIGEIQPKSINVIPLFEEWLGLINLDNLLFKLFEVVSPKYLRVFLAKSDPALHYGLIPSVILVKLALSKIRKFTEREGVNVYPIIGVGSLPFRGHLSPSNLANFVREYKGVNTVTIQCGLKYDYPESEVKAVVEYLNRNLPKGEAEDFLQTEQILLSIASKFRDAYYEFLLHAAKVVEKVSRLVPARRARRLHVGLFGYSRTVGNVTLPRAIPFTASFYSLGLPPEFIGFRIFGTLKEDEQHALLDVYKNLKEDLRVAAEFFSWRNLETIRESKAFDKEFIEFALPLLIEDIKVAEEVMGLRMGPNSSVAKRHENYTNDFILLLSEGKIEEAKQALVTAAKLRRSLG